MELWKIVIDETANPYVDEILGADVIDLDNYTYFNTLKELKGGERIKDW